MPCRRGAGGSTLKASESMLKPFQSYLRTQPGPGCLTNTSVNEHTPLTTGADRVPERHNVPPADSPALTQKSYPAMRGGRPTAKLMYAVPNDDTFTFPNISVVTNLGGRGNKSL
eukprot:262232-Rhodomonas_salina.1